MPLVRAKPSLGMVHHGCLYFTSERSDSDARGDPGLQRSNTASIKTKAGFRVSFAHVFEGFGHVFKGFGDVLKRVCIVLKDFCCALEAFDLIFDGFSCQEAQMCDTSETCKQRSSLL